MTHHPTVYYLRQLIGCTITDVQKVENISGMANHDTHLFSFTDTEGVARELYLDADCAYFQLDWMFKLKEPVNG
jgi:hypothetical protein